MPNPFMRAAGPLLVAVLLGTVNVRPAEAEAVAAARGLLGRLLPRHANQFQLEAIAPDNGRDVFEIEARAGKVVLRGNNGVALASALNWYLKYYCQAHVSWCGDQLTLPRVLPAVPAPVRRVSSCPYRYCFNYCAFSYSLAWWDWPQWERMIDWMALHGINLPLAVTGQEAVWQAVLRQLGLTETQVKEFLVGPAFLPFGWMGCLDGWGGPLPERWIEKHAALERQILARQRQFGMTPVLQGFTGHVPGALTNLFPGAKLQRLPSWAGFAPTHFLDPQDPLFLRVGQRFVEEQTRLFGTDHFYAADTFIEMQPPSKAPEFLAAMGRAVFEAMRAADPAARWVLQGWLFVNNPDFWQPDQGRALLGAVPADRLLALDLFCESTPAWSKTEAFYDKPWIWCVIQNFGGTVSLHGALPRMASDLRQARTTAAGGQLRGVGLIFEGLDYNPIVQDFVTEMAWHDAVPPVEEWALEFVRRRYGRLPAHTREAWRILLETAYRRPGRSDSVLCARPAARVGSGGSVEPALLARAWEHLLADADSLGRLDTYQYDLAHVAREALNSLGPLYHARIPAAVSRRHPAALAQAGRDFLGLIDDLDRLLGTRPEFLLGRWLADARRWGATQSERRLYEFNARNLITLWGPRDSVLHEYAMRQWSGLLKGFYGARWRLFLERQAQALEQGRTFDAAKFEQDIRLWEEKWNHQTGGYPTKPAGDTVRLARQLWQKYRAAFAPDAPSLTTGKPAACSFALPDFPASLANDGRRLDTERYWATDVTRDAAAWWQVDLEQPARVGRVVVVAYYGDQRYYGFTVEVSRDGQQWDLVADRRANREPATAEGYTCRFAPRPARYIRVTQTHNSANTGRHLVEVLAFEQ